MGQTGYSGRSQLVKCGGIFWRIRGGWTCLQIPNMDGAMGNKTTMGIRCMYKGDRRGA